MENPHQERRRSRYSSLDRGGRKVPNLYKSAPVAASRQGHNMLGVKSEPLTKLLPSATAVVFLVLRRRQPK
jgi:hypothetical protein